MNEDKTDPKSFESAEAAVRAAIAAAASENKAVIAEGVAATAAFAEAIMAGTFSFEAMAGAPKGARAFQCVGGGHSVLICEYNDRGRIGYEGTLVTQQGSRPLIVRLVPKFVESVYRVIVAKRN
jgi:hypothetical protein